MRDLLLTILGSAGVAALVSSGMNAIDRWRERTAREKELLFRSAIEISKITAERFPKDSEHFTPGLELMMVEKTHEILEQVYKTRKISETNKAFLQQFLKKKDRTAEKA
jgi:hypothetical protein